MTPIAKDVDWELLKAWEKLGWQERRCQAITKNGLKGSLLLHTAVLHTGEEEELLERLDNGVGTVVLSGDREHGRVCMEPFERG